MFLLLIQAFICFYLSRYILNIQLSLESSAKLLSQVQNMQESFSLSRQLCFPIDLSLLGLRKKHDQHVLQRFLPCNALITVLIHCQDIHKPRSCNQFSPALKLANGYILPEGKLTPNALFVGGIDMKVISDYYYLLLLKLLPTCDTDQNLRPH